MTARPKHVRRPIEYCPVHQMASPCLPTPTTRYNMQTETWEKQPLDVAIECWLAGSFPPPQQLHLQKTTIAAGCQNTFIKK